MPSLFSDSNLKILLLGDFNTYLNGSSVDGFFPRSHVLRGNAVLDALRPVYATLPVTRGAARLHGVPTRRVGTRKAPAWELASACLPQNLIVQVENFLKV